MSYYNERLEWELAKAFFTALELNKYETAEALIPLGVQPNMHIQANFCEVTTPLCEAVKMACKKPWHDMTKILEKLLENGGRLDMCDHSDNYFAQCNHKSCLHVACVDADILSHVLKHNTYPITLESRRGCNNNHEYDCLDPISNELCINIACSFDGEHGDMTPYDWALENNMESAKILSDYGGTTFKDSQ